MQGHHQNLFEKLKEEYRNSGIVPVPHTLRQEAVLGNSQGTYNFDFDNNRTPKVTEVKLSKSDVFVSFGWALLLTQEDPAKLGSGPLRPFVDGAVFPAAAGFTPGHLEVLYNGNLKAQVDTSIVFDSISTDRFRKVASEFFMDLRRFEPLMPSLKLNGLKKNNISLNIPTFAGMQLAGVGGVDNKVILELEGFILRGAADIDYKRPS